MAGRNQSRSSVSSIVSGNSVSTAQQVPFREQIFTAAMLTTPAQIAAALAAIQREIALATQSARSLAFLGGTWVLGVSFVTATPQTIAHRVNTQGAVSWIACRPRATDNADWTLNEESQNTVAGTVTLISHNSITVDLYFFESPT